MINCTSCNMLRTNDQSSTKISNAKISDYIKNTIEFDVITNMEDLVNQHESLSDSYQAEIEVTTVNILEIYKREQMINSEVSSYTNEEIMELISNNSGDIPVYKEILKAEIKEINGEWVLVSDEAVQSIINKQVNANQE